MAQQRQRIRRLLVAATIIGAPLAGVAALSATIEAHAATAGYAVIPSDVSNCGSNGTSGDAVDVAAGVNAGAASGDTKVSLGLSSTEQSDCDGAYGTAITPDGTEALVATGDNFLSTITNLGGSPSSGATVDLSYAGSGATATGVAIDPAGNEALVATGLPTLAVLSATGDTYAQPGSGEITVKGTNPFNANASFDGVAISSVNGGDGNPVALAVDGFDGIISVITGVGVSPQAAGEVSAPEVEANYNANTGVYDDLGNGGAAFSPASADWAVIPSADGVDVINASTPSDPTLTDVGIAGVSGSGGGTSAAVAPDGSTVVVAAGNSLYFYSGLTTGSLTQSASPLSVGATGSVIDSIAYTNSQNLVVNYSNSAGSAASVAVIENTMSATPNDVSPDATVTGGASPDVNGMSVFPSEVAGSAPPPPTTTTTTGAGTTTTTAPGGTTTTTSPGSPQEGYDMVGRDGGVFVFGSPTGYYGSLPGLHITVSNIVGMAPAAGYQGYYLVGSDGGVFSFGTTNYVGSLPGLHITVHNIVGIVPTYNDQGYFLVGSDGGVFSFGNSNYEGSLPGDHISTNSVVGIAATSDDNGYWVVESNGSVYGFGDANYFGNASSAGGPITSIAGTSDGGGYWVTNSNGGVQAFGDAKTFPVNGPSPAPPIVSVVATPDNQGYWLIGAVGSVYVYGDAPNIGSLPSLNVVVNDVVGAVPTQTG